MAEGANLGEASGKITIDTSDLAKSAREMNQAGKQLLGFGTALASGFVLAVKTSADFETQISAIKAVTAATEEDMTLLTEAAMSLGQDGPFGPIEVAEAFLELAKAGLSATEIVNGAGQATINLAKAGDLPIARAAEIAANSMRTFGIAAEDVNGVVDTLSGAANQSTLDVEDLAVSMRYTGGVAAALQIPLEDVATALALLGNAGIKGSTGGTSLRRILLQLSPDSKEARGELEKLGIITEDGANQFFNAAGEAKDLNTVFKILRDSTSGLTDEQKINSINTIFGARASAAALILMEQAGQGFIDMDAAIAKTDAATVAAERLDNLNGSIRKLKAAFQAYLVDAGGPFQEQVKKIVDKLTDFVKWMQNTDSPMSKFILLGSFLVGVLFIMAGGMLLAAAAASRFWLALKVLPGIILAVTRATSALTIALWANPILLIIAAIIALGVALFILYKKNEGFRKFVDNLWQTIQVVWDKILNFFKALGRWFADAYKDIEPVVRKIVGAIVDFGKKVGEIFVEVKDKVVDFASAVKRIFLDVVDFFRDLPGNIVKHIDNLLENIGGFFKSLPGKILGAIKDLGPKLGAFFLQALRQLPNVIAYALGFIIGFFIGLNFKILTTMAQLFVTLLPLVWQGLQWLWDAFLDILGKVFNFFVDWTLRIISKAIEFAKELPGKIIEFLASLPGKIKELLGLAWDKFKDWSWDVLVTIDTLRSDFQTKLVEFLKSLPTKIKDGLIDAITAFAGFGRDVISKTAEWLLELAALVVREMKALPGQITAALGDVGSWLYETGRKVVEGFIKGVKSMATSLYGAAQDAVGSFFSGIKDGFGIFSPSRLMKGAGIQVMKGFNLGVQKEAIKSMRLATNISDAFTKSMAVQSNLSSSMSIGSMLSPARVPHQSAQAPTQGSVIEKIEINNPVGETSEQSLYSSMQKLQYVGVLP